MAPRLALDIRRAAIALLGTFAGLTAAWELTLHLPIA